MLSSQVVFGSPPIRGPVFVTGANGFVGMRLCVHLQQAGVTVRGMVRRSDAELPRGVERVVVPNLGDGGALRRAMAGMRSVVHLAARVHVMREDSQEPLAAFRRANVEGTEHVLAAARAENVERLVFLSSVKVNGEGRSTAYTEADLPQPQDAYAISKLETERLLSASAGRVEHVILRPPLVYGPGVRGNFLRLLRVAHAAQRLPVPLGSIRNRRSLLFVGNLTDAIVHLLARDYVGGKVFLVSDGEDLSTTELVRRIGKAAGRRVVLLPFPGALLRLGAQLLGRGGEADRVLGSLTVDISRLRATGWSPPFTVDQGLAETVGWWRERSR